jgi:hypothetical protein
LAWLGAAMTPTVAYPSFVPGFVIFGIGMALFFAPVANVVLSAVLPSEEGARPPGPTTRSEKPAAFSASRLYLMFQLRRLDV